jgi:hypothetical protein
METTPQDEATGATAVRYSQSEAEGIMRAYHLAWLKAHPERSREWLKAMLVAGFEVHHVDGNHHNDHPANLVLIDHVDHLRLHGLFGFICFDPRAAARKGAMNRWKGKTQKEKSAHAKMMAMVGVLKRRKEMAEQRKAAHKARKS